jgi:hypothetical protein
MKCGWVGNSVVEGVPSMAGSSAITSAHCQRKKTGKFGLSGRALPISEYCSTDSTAEVNNKAQKMR